MKVVINRTWGGFSLSEDAVERLKEGHGITEASRRPYPEDFGMEDDTWLWRGHPALVAVVEELGEKADGSSAELAVVEVPDDVQWHITEVDGVETIRENHRTWC